MTTSTVEAMAALGLTLIIALLVIPTALASLIGAQWLCAGVALVALACSVAWFLRQAYKMSKSKVN